MVAEVLCCPAAEELAAFRLGQLSPGGVENLAGHLEQCSECRARLESLDAEADALLEALRRPPESEPFSDEPGCRFALARVLSLGEPGADLPDGGLFPGRVGSYRLIRPLGRGAMGCVYEALHTRLKRLVAVKLLSGRRGTDLPSLARFQREMEAIGKLDHPNIIRATDAGEVDGVPFLVMEFVDGPDLARVVKTCGPLSTADACEVIRQAALGLQHAYEHGLVHRDLKPSNLLLGQGGVVKVLDLGLALFQGEHASGRGFDRDGPAPGHVRLHGSGTGRGYACRRRPGRPLQSRLHSVPLPGRSSALRRGRTTLLPKQDARPRRDAAAADRPFRVAAAGRP